MTRHSSQPAEVAAAFAAFPPPERATLSRLRDMILEVASDMPEVGPLTETLKWGEPAYLTQATGSGSTLRLGRMPKEPGKVAIFVNCRTVLADRMRARFPEIEISGSRAIVMKTADPLPEAMLRECIALALTYHRWKDR
ncbi:DUF1801 domain-containing protein [Pseudooceanicola sp. C21-150M6]|uniref:DUF1801 domain-containing protein n=1 Tax=Pseudooceanicola sp. C21-150M6 TaxID=3434355 RepID=UPI003D7FB211